MKAEFNACIMSTVSCVHVNILLVKDIQVCHSAGNEEL